MFHSQSGVSKILILALFGFLAAVVLGIVFIVISSGSTPTPTPVTLTVWGVWDDTSDLSALFSAYSRSHPYIKISYRKLRYEEYEDALLKAWATNTGPDIYALPSTWIKKYKTDFITPVPKTTKVAYYSTKKALFKTETVIEYKTDTSLSASDLRRNYIDLVYDDVIIDGAIWGLPFGIDTLVMYYNRELLNQASLIQPPVTWNDFTNVVSRLALVDDQQNIVRAAAALGTIDNIPRPVDILTLLMLQNGTTMAVGNTITFSRPSASDGTYFPGAEALRFYTDFANPQKSVYTWNAEQPSAIDQFAQGELAFLIGYRFNEPEIKSKNRGVDYGIAPVPQVNPDTNVTFANYNVYTVAKQSKRANEAWNFIQFASNPSRLKGYLAGTNQISPVRSVLQEQLDNPDLALLAQQALTATSWFHGKNPDTMEEAFTAMIESALTDPNNLTQYVQTAANTIQQGY